MPPFSGNVKHMPYEWLQIAASSVGGAALVKLFDYLHDELRRHRDRTHSAKDLLTKHHDPILKAADELVGEIRSLAVTDFADFRVASHGERADVLVLRRAAAVFYVVQFWSHLQLLKLELGYVALKAGEAGTRLQRFIQHLESRAVRVVDRKWQRSAGEAILVPEEAGGGQRPMNLYQFATRYQNDEQFRAWFEPLAALFEATSKDQTSRQRILKYGVVVHALIDTQDPEHVVTTWRDPWPNKLTHSVRKDLAYGTFRTHLPFVQNSVIYTAPPKKGGPSGLAASSKVEQATLPIGPAKIED